MPYKNKEDLQARNKRYYQQHKGGIKARSESYYYENHEAELMRRADYRENHKDDMANYRNRYKTTARGWSLQAWKHINERAENHDGKNPAYADVLIKITQSQFLEWCSDAYNVARQKYGQTKLSIDRIDNDGHYELGNLQIIPHSENAKKDKPNVCAPEGMAWCGRCQIYWPRNCFYKNRNAYNGLASRCKSCCRATRRY